jgi:hypothetical protein
MKTVTVLSVLSTVDTCCGLFCFTVCNSSRLVMHTSTLVLLLCVDYRLFLRHTVARSLFFFRVYDRLLRTKNKYSKSFLAVILETPPFMSWWKYSDLYVNPLPQSPPPPRKDNNYGSNRHSIRPGTFIDRCGPMCHVCTQMDSCFETCNSIPTLH